MENKIRLLEIKHKPHYRSCEVSTTVGTYKIIGFYEKTGLNGVLAHYYAMDIYNPNLCIKVHSEIVISEHINSEIIDIIFHKGMQKYMKYIENYCVEVKKYEK